MNPQLAAAFAAHKTAIFGAAAAGAVGLGLWTKKKKSAAAATTSAGSPTSIAGTIPAAAVVSPSSSGAYDSSAFDAYNALQPELEQILQQQNLATSSSSGGISSAVGTPIASTLFAPSDSENLVRYGDGTLWQIQSDGSAYNVTTDEANHLVSNGAYINQLGYDHINGPFWDLNDNMAVANAARQTAAGTK